MSKINLLIVAVIMLVGINLIMMWQLTKRPGHARSDNRSVIIEKLNFDEAQVKAFDELVVSHQKDIRHQEDSIRQYKSALYAQALVKQDSTLANDLVARITSLQTAIEWIHYRHFEDIRLLCRPEQLPAFHELSNELAAMFNARKPHPQGPKP